jgi:hypothetical protein
MWRGVIAAHRGPWPTATEAARASRHAELWRGAVGTSIRASRHEEPWWGVITAARMELWPLER